LNKFHNKYKSISDDYYITAGSCCRLSVSYYRLIKSSKWTWNRNQTITRC